MSLERRTFIRTVAAASVVSLAVTRTSTGSEAPSRVAAKSSLPRGLRTGSRIGIACPASGVTRHDLEKFEGVCHSQGYQPVLGRNVSKRDGYLSAPDQQRADEFMEMIEDPKIEAIVCARGGYGVMRILPMLDYEAIRQANKIIMGFSDITALLIAANQMSGVVTFHGPVAISTFDDFTIESLNAVLNTSSLDVVGKDEAQRSDLLSFRDDRVTTIVPGIGRGRLTGGNLAMIEATLGTKYEIDTKGAILFLEEINEEPYRIDRMLTHLWLSGKLQECKGIAIGNFKNCEAKGISISGPSFTLREVIT